MWDFILGVLGLGQVCSMGNTAFSGYVDFINGNSDVIISAPHGGMQLDPRIPDREPGCVVNDTCVWNNGCVGKNATRCKVVTLGDLYTIEIARKIAEDFQSLTGKKPYVIINNLSRRQMDANRPRDEGTSGNPIAEQVWDTFQGYINYSKCLVKNGLYLDIHGHGHPEGNVELGYRISKEQLNNGDFSSYKSTLRWATEKTGFNLITGGNSFGHILSSMGYSSVPSPSKPKPGQAKYFQGGYNVLTHGSLNGGEIDGIQVEIPRVIRLPETTRNHFSLIMAEVINKFRKIRKGEEEFYNDSDEDEDDWYRWWE